jgi:Uncharacterized protein conserved in bacteria
LFLKIVAVVVIIAVLIIGGCVFYITRGLETGKNMEIGNLDVSGIENGTYSGKYNGGRFSNEVKVTVQGGKITNIEVVKSVRFEKPESTSELLKKVIDKQDTDIDIISGATVTSKAYLKSIENALSK